MKRARCAHSHLLCADCVQHSCFVLVLHRVRLRACSEFCKKKAVKHSYHKACLPCAKERNVCAMCREASEVIIDLPKSREEELREAQAREEALKGMRERERRTALRKMEREAALAEAERKGEATGDAAEGNVDDGDDDDDNDDDDELDDEMEDEGGMAPAGAHDGDGGGAGPPRKDDLDWEAMSSDDDG